jgi:hypothetical protein
MAQILNPCPSKQFIADNTGKILFVEGATPVLQTTPSNSSVGCLILKIGISLFKPIYFCILKIFLKIF